jgi:hypothetical protein
MVKKGSCVIIKKHFEDIVSPIYVIEDLILLNLVEVKYRQGILGDFH